MVVQVTHRLGSQQLHIFLFGIKFTTVDKNRCEVFREIAYKCPDCPEKCLNGVYNLGYHP